MSYRLDASLEVTISLEVYQDFTRGYAARLNDPGEDDEVEAEHIESAEAGSIDLFRALGPEAAATLRQTLQMAFSDEIDEAIEEARS